MLFLSCLTVKCTFASAITLSDDLLAEGLRINSWVLKFELLGIVNTSCHDICHAIIA